MMVFFFFFVYWAWTYIIINLIGMCLNVYKKCWERPYLLKWNDENNILNILSATLEHSVMNWTTSLNVFLKTKRRVCAPGCKCSSGARWGRTSSPLGRCCHSPAAWLSAGPAREPEPRRRNRMTGKKRTRMTRTGGWKTYCCFWTRVKERDADI